MKIKMILKLVKKHLFPLFRKKIKTTKIDGQKIKYIHIDKGTPYTIIFENGLGTGMSFWDKTFVELSCDHNVFAYSRTFQDDTKIMKKEWDKDAQCVTQDIKKVLDGCNVEAPYILVGHSLGGLYVQLFAKEYPDMVKAMVLVDATYPDEFSDMEAMDVPLKLQKSWKYLSKNATDIGQGLLASPMSKELPTIILSALLKEDVAEHPEWEKMIESMHKKQETYLTLYPWAKQTWVDSGHNIHFEKPEVVIGAIKDILDTISLK